MGSLIDRPRDRAVLRCHGPGIGTDAAKPKMELRPLKGVTDVQGRVAVITGGAGGIGLAAARRFVQAGVKVALLDIHAEKLEAANRELTAAGGEVLPIQVDITDPAKAAQAVNQVVERWGRLDILVNNAGIAGPSKPMWDYTDDEWHSVVQLNLNAVFYVTRAAIVPMLKAQSGRIINIASIAGKEGNPNAVAYSATKSAVIGLTKALAKEVATRGIYVNCITPAVIQTDILKQVSQEHINYMVSRIPMGRVGQPEEVAALIFWLASDECSFSTGAVFDISGGRATY